MALRWPLEGHFELFWALLAKCLSDGLWMVILRSSGLWWPKMMECCSKATFWAKGDGVLLQSQLLAQK